MSSPRRSLPAVRLPTKAATHSYDEEEDELGGTAGGVAAGDEESFGDGEDVDAPCPAPGSVHSVTYGASELQECFDSRAAAAAAAGTAAGDSGPTFGVVSWHANWSQGCQAAAQQLHQLAARHPQVAFYTLDVEGSAANSAVALEKVMRKPESRRAGGLGGAGLGGCVWDGESCPARPTVTPPP